MAVQTDAGIITAKSSSLSLKAYADTRFNFNTGEITGKTQTDSQSQAATINPLSASVDVTDTFPNNSAITMETFETASATWLNSDQGSVHFSNYGWIANNVSTGASDLRDSTFVYNFRANTSGSFIVNYTNTTNPGGNGLLTAGFKYEFSGPGIDHIANIPQNVNGSFTEGIYATYSYSLTISNLNGVFIQGGPVNLMDSGNALFDFSDNGTIIPPLPAAPVPSTLVMASILFGMLGVVWGYKRLNLPGFTTMNLTPPQTTLRRSAMKSLQACVRCQVAFVLLGFGVASAEAHVFVVSQPTDLSGASLAANVDQNAVAFDNFSIPSNGIITSVGWTGSFLNHTAPTPFADVLINWYQDNGGRPGKIFADSVLIPSQTSLGNDAVGNPAFAYSANLVDPLQLAGNTPYWLSIEPDVRLPNVSHLDWGWEFGIGGDGRSFASNSPNFAPELVPHDLSFTLHGQFPEPAGPTLLGLGFCSFGALTLALRRKSSWPFHWPEIQ
jgi:hypothetical protein